MTIFKKNADKGHQRLNKAAHIKPKTIGTSNEISMSVLHAANEKEKEEEKKEQSSFSQNLSTSFDSEVKEKKAKRRRNRMFITFVAFAVAAVLTLGVAFGIHMYMSRINGFGASFNSAIEYLSRTDEALNLVNSILENPTSDTSKQKISEAFTLIEDSEVPLERCQITLSDVQEKALFPSEKEKAYRLTNSLEGRQEVFSTGKQILTQLNSALDALNLLDKVKEDINQSALQEKTAADLVANPTTENLSSALTAVQNAQEYIRNARASFNEMKASYPEADFNNYEQFLTCKSEALQHQADAITSIQGDDTEKARVSQTNYESAENQAKKYAEKIALSGNPVVEIYEKNVEELVQKYETARSQVAAADEYLRKNM